MNKRYNKKIAEAHLTSLIKKYNIEVKEWRKTSSGSACLSSRSIAIPKPVDIDSFCVALHECGHVIKNTSKRKMPLYKSEFIAEKFAIEQAELLGFNACSYKERARRYIIMNISVSHFRNQVDVLKIPKEIREFCKIDFSTWKDKKVFVRGWGIDTYKNKSLEIAIF